MNAVDRRQFPRIDVGLRFTELAGDAAAQLARVLSPEE
jgi:hypothetical protein